MTQSFIPSTSTTAASTAKSGTAESGTAEQTAAVPDLARRANRRPSTLSLGMARTRIEVKQFFREKASVVFTFLFPVMMLFIFGSVFNREMVPGVSFTQYFTAGMIASGIILSSFQSLAIGISMERDDGTLKRLYGSPMPPAAYFLGKIGLVLVTSIVQIGILLSAGTLVFGLDLPSSAGLWWRFTWVMLLGSAAGTVMGIAYSSLIRSGRSAGAVVSPVVIILQFISGVFFVYSELPKWMQGVAAIFPLKWLAQGMRSVFLPPSFVAQEAARSWQLPWIAIVLALWTVAGLFVCIKTFRWQRRGDG